jgi:hypothetical protein
MLLQEPEGTEAVQGWWLRPSSSWSPTDALLAAGACVVARARAAVKASLGFSCSAGIAHSKILAKLGSVLHKPAQQTLVPGALPKITGWSLMLLGVCADSVVCLSLSKACFWLYCMAFCVP